MIIRLSPEQVASVWESLRPSLLETLMPLAEVNATTAQRVLRSLLSEDMQLWLGIEKVGDFSQESVFGFMVTTIYKDLISESKTLLIYAVVETRDIPASIWTTALRKLNDFALIHGCFSIIAYTDNPRMAEMSKILGFRHRIFMRKEV